MADTGGLAWRKSSHSGGSDQCVEVVRDGDHMLVRDSKDPAGPVLSYTEGEWRAFVAGVRAGELDWNLPN
jgi:hypothetical protein